jgi:hypothetical protein
MSRFTPIRMSALIIAIALAVPGAAQAAQGTPRDQVAALAATIRASGYTSYAADIEALASTMSDADAQALADAGITRVTAGINTANQAKVLAESMGVSFPAVEDPTAAGRSAGFPDGDYPDPAKCTESPGGSNFDVVFVLFTSVKTARAAVDIAADIVDLAGWACSTVVVAIGIGGNPQTVACAIAQIALTAANGILSGFEVALDVINFCDGAITFSDVKLTVDRLEHIHSDLDTYQGEIKDTVTTEASVINTNIATHDSDMKLLLSAHDTHITTLLGQHDTDVKLLLDDIISRLGTLDDKVQLGLKSQAEIAMHKRFKTRPSVFYEERLDEICGYAQEAITDLPVVYLAASQAQAMYDRAIQYKITDPKRAADECIRAFLAATVRSDTIQ